MHESRGFPRFLPRTGKRLSVTVGRSDEMQSRINILRESRGGTTMGEHKIAQLRATITHTVQEQLEELGNQVTGLVNESVRESK